MNINNDPMFSENKTIDNNSLFIFSQDFFYHVSC